MSKIEHRLGLRETDIKLERVDDSSERLKNDPGDLVFVLMKPLAMEDTGRVLDIMGRLSQYGALENVRSRLATTEDEIVTHYKAAEGMCYFPPMVEYLAEQRITHFVLRDKEPLGSRDESFAEFLRGEVIGPSDPLKAESHHIRHQVLEQNLRYKVPVDLSDDRMVDGYKIAFDNLIHCSDSTVAALTEIANWYQEDPEVVQHYSDEFEYYIRGLDDKDL